MNECGFGHPTTSSKFYSRDGLDLCPVCLQYYKLLQQRNKWSEEKTIDVMTRQWELGVMQTAMTRKIKYYYLEQRMGL